MNNQPIAIKTLLSSASSIQRIDFLKEAIIMNQFNHKHIIHLLGVCFHNDFQPQFLVSELMEQGDLQNYLRRSRPNKINQECKLSYNNCLDIARQIADGACYLEQHLYVHRYKELFFVRLI
jgi:serine/threonine protein kinase